MLPKLQQSSIAQSLRRDNPANHNYCNCAFIQAKTNWKTSSATTATKIINLGRTNLPQKTHILPLVTSPKNTFRNPNSLKRRMNQTTKALSQVPSPNIKEREEPVESVQAPSKRRRASMNPFQSVELSKKDKSHFQSSEGIMIGETSPFALTTKAQLQSWSGRCLRKL